jgi:hypothetical protein
MPRCARAGASPATPASSTLHSGFADSADFANREKLAILVYVCFKHVQSVLISRQLRAMREEFSGHRCVTTSRTPDRNLSIFFTA